MKHDHSLAEKQMNTKGYALWAGSGLVIIAATLVYCYMLSRDLVRPGGFSSQWSWGRRELNTNSIPNLPSIYQATAMVFVALSITWLMIHRRIRVAAILAVSLNLILALNIFLGVTIQTDYGFHGIPITVVNNDLTGYFNDAVVIEDPEDFFVNYQDFQSSLMGRSGTHPPANHVFFWAIISLFERIPVLGSAVMHISDKLHINYDYLASIDIVLRNKVLYQASLFAGLLLPLTGLLCVVFIYFLGTIMFDRRIGVIASSLMLCIPSFIIMTPFMDQIYAILGIIFLTIYAAGAKKQNRFLVIISSLIFTISFFFSIAVMLLLPIAFIVSMIINDKDTERETVPFFSYRSFKEVFSTRGFLILIQAIIVELLVLALFKVNAYSLVQAILGFNQNFNITWAGGRSYGFWVVNNLYDYFLFLGIPVTILFLLRMLLRGDSDITDKGRTFAIIILVYILLLDLTGISFGEVSRLWMFMMPVFVLAAATVIYDIGKKSDFKIGSLLAVAVVMQIVQTTAFRIFLEMYRLPQLPFFHYRITGSDFHLLHLLF